MDRKKFLKTSLMGTVAAVGSMSVLNAATGTSPESKNTTDLPPQKGNQANNQHLGKIDSSNIELLTAFFTISGDIHPFGPTEVSPFDFKYRVEAAAKAGYKGFGLIRDDILHYEESIGLKEMKKILDANGITKVEFEFLGGWYSKGKDRDFSDQYRKDLLRAADVLKPINIKVAPTIGIDESGNDIPLMVSEFKKLAQEAAAHGTSIALEIMPFSNIRTVKTALQIVEGANEPNAGLLLDIWHINRGNIPYSDIAKIPLRFIKSIELNDAERYPISPLWMDTIHRRKLCGEGVFDVKGFIRAVQATGYKGHWGVEVLSAELRVMSLEDMTKKSYDTTIAHFA